MKTLFSTVLLLFVVNTINAQITITSSDLPQAGETYVMSTDTTPIINIGSASPNFQSWDFSSLTQQYQNVPTFGLTSATPYASSFSASNIYTYGPAALFGSFAGGAPVSSQGMNIGYMFWKTDATGYWIVGFRADSGAYSNVNVFENPRELLIGTPATYGTNFTNSGRWEFPMNLIPMDVDTYYVSNVYKTLNADAWGSLTTPTSIFNVLRIHEHVIKVDSIYAKLGVVQLGAYEVIRDTINKYIFMANGINYPICIVHADKNNVLKKVEYYNFTYLNTKEHFAENTTKAFPNPFTDKCTIELGKEFLKGNISFSVYDYTGKELLKETVSSTKITLDAQTFNSGIHYYVAHNAQGERVSGKLVIIK